MRICTLLVERGLFTGNLLFFLAGLQIVKKACISKYVFRKIQNLEDFLKEREIIIYIINKKLYNK